MFLHLKVDQSILPLQKYSGQQPLSMTAVNEIILFPELKNIEKGTDGFNQNMEALTHNFLFRGYFRKQEKQKKK